MMRSAADLDTPKSRASRRIVKSVRQYAATSRARSSSGRLHGRPLADRIRTLAPQHGHQLAEEAGAQPGERGCPGRLRRRDHTSHIKIISPVTSSYGTALRRRPTSLGGCSGKPTDGDIGRVIRVDLTQGAERVTP